MSKELEADNARLLNEIAHLSATISSLNSEIKYLLNIATNLKETIGCCFMPHDYTQTCRKCVNAVKEYNEASDRLS